MLPREKAKGTAIEVDKTGNDLVTYIGQPIPAVPNS